LRDVIEPKRIDNFDQSLRQCIDDAELKKFDEFVTLFWRVAGLLSILVPLALAALQVAYGIEIALHPIYSLAIVLFGLAVYVGAGILYQYAKTKDNFTLRFQIVVIGVLCLLFGIPGVFLISLEFVFPRIHPSFWLWNAFVLLWMVALMTWGVLLDGLIVDQVSRKMKDLLKERVKPFSNILGSHFSSRIIHLRTFAFAISICYASILWVLLFPETLFLLLFYFVILVAVHFLRKQPDHAKNYYGVTEVIDIATFCLRISTGLMEFGIREYKVHHMSRMFSGFVSVFSTEVYPEGHYSVLVIHPAIRSPDYNTIQIGLEETWNPELRGRVLGPYVCPFRPFQGRILIDSEVWNAEKILWWGPDHRIAVEIRGVELRRNNSLQIGNYYIYELP
jgi:hypothetical protein